MLYIGFSSVCVHCCVHAVRWAVLSYLNGDDDAYIVHFPTEYNIEDVGTDNSAESLSTISAVDSLRSTQLTR